MRASLALSCSFRDSLRASASSSSALLLGPGRLGVDVLLGPVGGPHLVEAVLGLEELLDLLEVHPERLAQLEDALELDQVARPGSGARPPAVYCDGLSRPSSS